VEQAPVRITAHGGVEKFRLQLGKFWNVGFVADVSLIDGSVVPAVLIAISSTALILDRWDIPNRAPAGDPLTLALAVMTEVNVP
jgi:hypothetical protein